MKPFLEKRIAHLQALMREAELDAILFTDRENLIYYFGVTQIECMGAVIPSRGAAQICCLWMDAPYVKEQTGCTDIHAYHFPTSTIGATLVQAMREMGLTAPNRVGFHKFFVDLDVFAALNEAFPSMEYCPATTLTYKARAVKDETEIALMRKACSFLSQGMAAAINAVAPGVAETEVLAEADYAMRKAGSEGASFRMQVLTPGKQMLAHPFADATKIQADQAIVIHLGASLGGYVGKMCRTVALGSIAEETKTIYEILLSAQQRAIDALCPGVTGTAIYEIVNETVTEAGYAGKILDTIGYGVGIRQSEFYPMIGKGIDHVLEENMVVDLLLPTIYQPGVGGPRVTDVIHVQATGGLLMTTFPRELVWK